MGTSEVKIHSTITTALLPKAKKMCAQGKRDYTAFSLIKIFTPFNEGTGDNIITMALCLRSDETENRLL
jgi:hypothetical protein